MPLTLPARDDFVELALFRPSEVQVVVGARSALFLPFADDDPKSVEILSKVLLFAEDKLIKDPGLLAQLRS